VAGLPGEPEVKALLTMIVELAAVEFTEYRGTGGLTDHLEGDLRAWIAGMDESDPLSASVKRMLGGNRGWPAVIAGRLRKRWATSS
jgi:hypothetical protein